MIPGKLTSTLAEKLTQAPDEELVEVVVELSTPGADGAGQTGSRAERIASLKEVFQRECEPVEQAITGAGGEVTGTAWINQTVRARVPVKAVGELSELREVRHLDLPRTLQSDAS